MKRRCAAGTGAIGTKASQACAFAAGEGASPLFPPAQLDQEAARAALLHVVRRDPHQFDIEGSRWRLHHLRGQFPDWSVGTDGGMREVLERLGIHDKRGRSSIHSPDSLSEEKQARRERIQALVRESSPQEVLLFLDECGIRRQREPWAPMTKRPAVRRLMPSGSRSLIRSPLSWPPWMRRPARSSPP